MNITFDEPPRLVKNIPDIEMDEDMSILTLVDLYDYFDDDFDSVQELTYSIVNATNSTIVAVGLNGNRYISADALTGSINDNWTGEVEMRVSATDTRGFSIESNEFRIIVRNVNDPPLITSLPLTLGLSGVSYAYNVIAVDGDNDMMVFGLNKKPEGMSINSKTGQISWIPSIGGTYPVSIEVSDGVISVSQDFLIKVDQANRPPRFIDNPLNNATIGKEYVYIPGVIDDDGDVLIYSLTTGIAGMTINATTGVIKWTPNTGQKGNNSVSLRVFDSKGGEAFQNFVINVTEETSPPPTKVNCTIGYPSPNAIVSRNIVVAGNAIKGTNPVIRVQIRIDGGNWLNATGIENWTYSLNTSLLKIGQHTIEARAFDNLFVSDTASVNFSVSNPEKTISVEGLPWWPTLLIVLIALGIGGYLIFLRVRKK